MSSPESPEQFEARREALFEKLHLKEQYESQLQVLNETGILELLPESQDMGVFGIEGEEHPAPTLDEIKKRITDPEMIAHLEVKHKQGFTKLLLVPHAMPVVALSEKLRKLIERQYKATSLKTSDGKDLELDEGAAVMENNMGQRSDAKGELLSYPESVAGGNMENELKKMSRLLGEDLGLAHDGAEDTKEGDEQIQGITKKEMIETGNSWELLLVRDASNAETQSALQKRARKKGELDQLESVAKIFESKKEVGLTLEGWHSLAISTLHEKGVLIESGKKSNRVVLFGSAMDLGAVVSVEHESDGEFVIHNTEYLAEGEDQVRSSVRIPAQEK
ncbi:hypothetical protein ACFL2D_00825 [Patescibacteria group bacterium]